MLSAIRKRLTYGNVAMTVALVFAMSGGAFAAGKFLITSTKQISPKVLKSLQGKAGKAGAQGPAGPAGPQGPAGANGKDGALGANGKDGVSVTGAAASVAECAAGGVKYTSASGSNAVCNGKNGTTGFTETLPSKKSETGTWGFTQTSEAGFQVNVPISFDIPLAAPLDGKHVQVNGERFPESNREACEALSGPEKSECEATLAEQEANCPGSEESVAATPGFLCVYTGGANNVLPSDWHPLNLEKAELGAAPGGSVLIASLPALALARGLWIVTAP